MNSLVQLGLGPQHLVVFGLVLARVAGLLLAGPPLGSREIPLRMRALLAGALALVIAPRQWSAALPATDSVAELALVAGGELLIGLALGLGVAWLFAGVQLAGQLVAQAGGLALANVFQPDADGELPLLSQFFYLVALAVFLTLGGHRLLVSGLLGTFAAIPPGGFGSTTPVVEAIVTLFGQCFSLGVRVAAPATAALLLASLALGAISRTLPQINLLVMGFGANTLVTLGVLTASLGGMAWLIQDEVPPAVQSIVDALANTGF